MAAKPLGRILVIDDDPNIVEMVIDYFGDSGYVVIGVPPAVPQPATIQRHEVVALQHVTRLEPIPALAPSGDGAAGT